MYSVYLHVHMCVVAAVDMLAYITACTLLKYVKILQQNGKKAMQLQQSMHAAQYFLLTRHVGLEP